MFDDLTDNKKALALDFGYIGRKQIGNLRVAEATVDRSAVLLESEGGIIKCWLGIQRGMMGLLVLAATVGLVACGEGNACPDDKDCSGLQCGPDPICGQSCGSCGSDKICWAGQCVESTPIVGDTWNDSSSGLTWQVTPTGDVMTWSEAEAYCAGLALDGGGWHLPTIGELRTLIRGCPATEDGGSCDVEAGDCSEWSCRDASCSGCLDGGGPADGCYWPAGMQGNCSQYWSSSLGLQYVGGGRARDLDTWFVEHMWFVNFYNGYVYYFEDFHAGVNGAKHVRCVRYQRSEPVDTYLAPGDKTWTDSTSNLTWQVEPTGETMTWSDAKAHCAGLALDGGGWHLPTIGDLRTLIRGCPGTITGGACRVTDDCLDSSCSDNWGCWNCSENGGPADGCYWPAGMQGNCSWYWSSSAMADGVDSAWVVGFDSGDVDGYSAYYDWPVRCVR